MGSNFNELEDQESINKRKSSRKAVKIVADLRISDGSKFRVDVLDLSSSGFRMLTANYIAVDRKVYLTIPNFQTLPARIAWNDRDFYGCEFATPLYGAIFEHLSNAYPDIVR